MQIGPKIRKLRELHGLKQEAVAHELGIHQTTYCRMEKEKNKETFKTERMEKLGKIYGVEPGDIMNFDEKFVINIHEQKGAQSGGVVINNNSDKVLAQHEARIKELEEKLALVIALHGKNEQ